MEISKFEQFITMDVGVSFGKTCMFFINPIIDCDRFIKVLYDDIDAFEFAPNHNSDDQLFKLGLDVNKINDKNKYLGYKLTDRRGVVDYDPSKWS